MIAFLRDLLFKDFWLKLFSLVLAVLIWFTVWFALHKEGTPMPTFALGQTEQHTFSSSPVIILSSAEDVRSFKVNPKEVEITVQGESKLVRNLQSREVRALVDLTGLRAAQGTHKHIEVSTPPGVALVRVYPPEVEVLFPARN